jgi:hypothetical protein
MQRNKEMKEKKKGKRWIGRNKGRKYEWKEDLDRKKKIK